VRDTRTRPGEGVGGRVDDDVERAPGAVVYVVTMGSPSVLNPVTVSVALRPCSRADDRQASCSARMPGVPCGIV
jgi:hypothetical protein